MKQGILHRRAGVVWFALFALLAVFAIALRVHAASLVVDTPASASAYVGSSRPITLSATNDGVSDITYTITALPTSGTLTVDSTVLDGSMLPYVVPSPVVTYTPSGAGSDSFAFEASDADETSAPVTVSIVVSAVPVGTPQSLSINEGRVLSGALSGTGGAAPLTYTITALPTNGSLSVDGVVLDGSMLPYSVVNPAATFSFSSDTVGPDSFAFTASDGNRTSASATVDITVGANTAPALDSIDDAYAVVGRAFSLVPVASDTDVGDVVVFGLGNDAPAGMSIDSTSGALSWTPMEGQVGANSITILAGDGLATSSRTFGVTVDQAPVFGSNALFSQHTVTVGRSVLAVFSVTDADNADSRFLGTFGLSGDVPVGASIASNGLFTWTPTQDQSGSTYSFNIEANDGVATTTAPVSLSVIDDLPPVFTGPTSLLYLPDTASTTLVEITARSGYSTVINGDSLPSWISLHDNGDGTVTLAATPASADIGAGTFDIVAGDGLATTTQTYSYVVDTPPTSADISLSTRQAIATTTTLVGSDEDLPPQALIFTIESAPRHGSLKDDSANTYTAGSLVSPGVTLIYTPVSDGSFSSGSDSFTYSVGDGLATSSPSTVSVSVSGDNPPSFDAIPSLVTDVGSDLNFSLTATDIDDDSVSYSNPDYISGGIAISLDPNTRTATWLAKGSGMTDIPRGVYFFSIRASDYLRNATKVISVQVKNAPTADDVATSTDENTAKNIVLGGTVEGTTTRIYAISNQSQFGGTLSLSDGVATYTPPQDFWGTDTFQYSLNDGIAESSHGTVTVTVAEGTPVVASWSSEDDPDTYPDASIPYDISSLGSGSLTTTPRSGDVLLQVPQGTTITDSNGQRVGTLTGMPTQADVSGIELPSSDPTVQNILTSGIEIGSVSQALALSQPVRIAFLGQTGKLAGWTRTTTLTPITTVCTADDATSVASQLAGDVLGDCYYDNGSDLIIWTKHFTTFALYSVVDTGAPVIVPPVDQTFVSTGALTTPVLIPATATDAVDPHPTVTYSPTSFPVGTTLVTWTATDASGNTSTATSQVTITAAPSSGGGGGGGGGGSSGGGSSSPSSGGGGGGGGPVGLMTAVIPQIATSTSAASSSGQVLGAEVFRFTRTLQIGSRGDDVSELQRLLSVQGFFSGQATGYFGVVTQAAVKKFQTANGLDAVGNVGPKTRAALNVLEASSTSATASTDNAALIAQLQAQLADLQAQLAKLLAKTSQ